MKRAVESGKWRMESQTSRLPGLVLDVSFHNSESRNLDRAQHVFHTIQVFDFQIPLFTLNSAKGGLE